MRVSEPNTAVKEAENIVNDQVINYGQSQKFATSSAAIGNGTFSNATAANHIHN